MTLPPPAPRPRPGRVWGEMIAGWRYVARAPLVRSVLILLGATSVLGGAYTTLLPMVAGKTLAGGPHTLGVLMAAAGVGALVGALYLANRASTSGLPGVVGDATAVLGVALVALRWAPSVWVAAPLVFACGLGWMVQMAATNTIIQTVVDADKLGRVMSVYAMAFFGGMPVGALTQGWLADQLGPMTTFACCGAAVLACAAAYRLALRRGAGRPDQPAASS